MRSPPKQQTRFIQKQEPKRSVDQELAADFSSVQNGLENQCKDFYKHVKGLANLEDRANGNVTENIKRLATVYCKILDLKLATEDSWVALNSAIDGIQGEVSKKLEN